MNRRRLVVGSLATALASRHGARATAQSTPQADEAIPVVTVTTPVVLEDGIIVDHYRVVRSPLDGDAVVLGSITNARDETVAIPAFDFDVSVRDQDRVILGSTVPTLVYPAAAPGQSIGFVAWFTEVSYDLVDPATVRFDLGPFSADDPILDQLAEATIEIESEEVISRTDDLQIEYVVRNTSDLEYSGLIPRIAVWDADWLFCGYAYASVLTALPPGDAIRFETHSNAGFINPLDIAGDDFTLEPWIVASVA